MYMEKKYMENRNPHYFTEIQLLYFGSKVPYLWLCFHAKQNVAKGTFGKVHPQVRSDWAPSCTSHAQHVCRSVSGLDPALTLCDRERRQSGQRSGGGARATGRAWGAHPPSTHATATSCSWARRRSTRTWQNGWVSNPSWASILLSTKSRGPTEKWPER